MTELEKEFWLEMIEWIRENYYFAQLWYSSELGFAFISWRSKRVRIDYEMTSHQIQEYLKIIK